MEAEDHSRRRQLVGEIEAEVQATQRYLGKDELDPRITAAIMQVPRHEFVDAGLQDAAYLNTALPIGCGQTISQPYIVAVMTDLLAMPAHGRVLEIGTGCGYQAAVLAQICAEVYSVEIVETLGREARERLARLGYDNVQVRIGDGADGWPAHAPYDGIVVTAAGDEVPPSLLGQLAPGGRLIMPVRSGPGDQNLVLCEKDREGMVHSRSVLPVVFVPLTGSRG